MAKIITEKKYLFDIPEGKKKERIDLYLTNCIENATRSRIQKLINSQFVRVNGKFVKSNYNISPFDKIEVTIPISPRPDKIEAENIPIEIVYEDDYLLVVNKPPGIVVHPAFGNFTGTLVHALLYHTENLSNYNSPDRPGIVHRLDKNTSGLLLVAKDPWVHAQLAKQFTNRTITREYWAVCWGILKEKEGSIVGNIARSKRDRKIFAVSEKDGKHAETLFSEIEQFEFASLVKLNLKTGRTHQIRVHMAHINNPIFGDPTYGGRKIVYGSNLPKMKSRVDNLFSIIDRQALHAKTIGFIHPKTKEELIFNSELPEDMKNLISKL
ncbi:MAG: RluA family pseudouridine synthase [Melioribacteraceae bacterium]|nr:RluA family pseudouridine synthase [Melioribacteraceae bacterium]